tara:strand:+ start:401410 stop:401631 length:222 start_codon:yes stop_codon:yes gene_type:complete
MVLIGGISLILFPLLLSMKRKFRLIFIFCGLGAIATSFLKEVIQLDYFSLVFLAIPLLIAFIKKSDMLKKKSE